MSKKLTLNQIISKIKHDKYYDDEEIDELVKLSKILNKYEIKDLKELEYQLIGIKKEEEEWLDLFEKKGVKALSKELDGYTYEQLMQKQKYLRRKLRERLR
jgi:hypothetical protein